MIIKLLRWLVGRIVLFINWLTWPRAGERSSEEQARIGQEVQGLALYQLQSCPFCVKVRRAMQRLNLPIETRDVRPEGEHRRTLLEQGGEIKAPCLRIDQADGSSEWMYESSDIVEYLQQRFPLAG